MKRQMIVLGMCTTIGLFGNIATSRGASSVWDFVDAAVLQSPEISAKESEALRAVEVSKSLASPENPIVELGWTNRTATGPSSKVASWGIRQKLPFWTSRSRQAVAQESIGEAARWEVVVSKRQATFDLVRQIYSLGRLEAEQEHMKDRRARFALIRNALEKTRAASPGQKVERKLIQSAVSIVEGQFEQIESEVLIQRSALNRVGPLKIQSLSLKWLESNQLKELEKKLLTSRTAPDPLTLKADAMFKATEAELQSTSARPEFEIFLNSDKERGGANEENITAGLSATLPFNSIWGADRRAAVLNRAKMEAYRQSTTRDLERSIANAALMLQASLKSLERFPLKKVLKIDSDVKEAEGQVRQSWITVSQFLEFDRQAHAQIEEIYNAQERAVEAVIGVCTFYECDVRELLGGSI